MNTNRLMLALFLSFILLLIPSALADNPPSSCTILPPLTYNQPILIQYCSNCSFVNFTSITYPNGTTSGSIYIGQQISPNTYINNSFLPDSSQLGTYTYSTQGNPNGALTSQCVSRDLTINGSELTTAQGLLYIIILVVAFFMFIICVVGGIMLPSSNKKDDYTGFVIAVENLKYVKMLCWFIAYLMLMLIFYMSWVISFGLLKLNVLASLFNFAFIASLIVLLPGFILFTYILIANWVRDSRLADQLSIGRRVRE